MAPCSPIEKKHYSPEQVIKLLGEADTRLNAGQGIAQVCQTLGIAESTFHRWRNQYGGMKGEEAKYLKELEKENTRLKRMAGNACNKKRALFRNDIWTYNVISDRLENAHALKVLALTDEYPQESLASEGGLAASGDAVAAVLDRVSKERGFPVMGAWTTAVNLSVML